MAAIPLTPEQLQSIMSGLRDQPDLMKIFKETLGLEAKVKDKEFSLEDIQPHGQVLR